MITSYRLRKKELVFLLDLAGDINKLEQGFGNIYINFEEHNKISAQLQDKGFVIKGRNEMIYTDSSISYIMNTIYNAKFAATDSKLNTWIYCSENLAVVISAGGLCADEYIITPYPLTEFLSKDFEIDSKEIFNIFRGENSEVTGDKIANIAERHIYG